MCSNQNEATSLRHILKIILNIKLNEKWFDRDIKEYLVLEKWKEIAYLYSLDLRRRTCRHIFLISFALIS